MQIIQYVCPRCGRKKHAWDRDKCYGSYSDPHDPTETYVSSKEARVDSGEYTIAGVRSNYILLKNIKTKEAFRINISYFSDYCIEHKINIGSFVLQETSYEDYKFL